MSDFTRRSLLRGAVAGACALLWRPALAAAAITEPQGRLALYNIHTRETLDVTYRDGGGRYDPGALKALNWLLRCHFTDEVFPIDVRVLEFVDLVDTTLGGGREIHVISGYRSHEYNEWLRKHGHGVARSSLHLEGRAIDVRVPGIALDRVHRSSLALARGGVGYYPGSDFVHLDSGRVRAW